MNIAMSHSPSLNDRFNVNGYVVVPGAIPNDLIDAVLQAQLLSRRNPLLIFRGQGVVSYERARWNAQGQMVRSIHNPHLLGFAAKLSHAIRSLVFSPPIAEALQKSTGIQRWVNWQTMLFDRSVGTDLHLDTWFLDTYPRGHLIGIWIALEDITAESGPFLIFPRSQNLPVATEMRGLAQLSDRTAQLRAALRDAAIDPKPLLLRKGDLVLWNSLVAHGSELPTTAGATRKSVTAHFYPYGMKVAAPPIRRIGSIYNHSRPTQMLPGQLWKAATIAPWLYSSVCLSMFGLQALRPPSTGSGTIRRG
jgi:ectoine hydroxylase-related dioxygenase (phytanoyl-CoA dioxygenase family)